MRKHAPPYAPAAFVLPIVRLNKWRIHPPDDNGFPALLSFRWVDGIPPYDVPSRMVVVGLDCPGASAALRLQGFVRRWIETPFQREIGESLPGHVGVFVALVWTEGIERPHARNPNYAAKDIRLLEI